jgi:hypothetical protein
MTRKEKLVMEIAEVRYELRTLKGQEAVMPEDYYNSHMYLLEVKNNKVYELEEQLKGLKESLEKTKLDNQIKERTEAFYATEEGMAFKAERQQEAGWLIDDWSKLEEDTLRTLDEQIKHRLGAHWGVGTIRNTYLEIGILDPTAERKFYFGQTAEIYCSLDIWKEKQRFEINVGTCGSTDLLGGNTEGERSRFYIGIGQLFASTDLCEWIKQTMMEYQEQSEAFFKQIKAIQDQIDNPLQA